MIKALEAKSVEGENDTSELKSDLEMVRMNFSLSGNRFKSLKDKFDKLQEIVDQLKEGGGAPVVSGDGNVDFSQFASKQKFDELNNRVKVIDSIQGQTSDTLANLEDRVVVLERSDTDQNNQIEEIWKNINQIVQNLNSNGPAIVPSMPMAKDSSADVKNLQN